jgi:hypothetical protein
MKFIVATHKSCVQIIILESESLAEKDAQGWSIITDFKMANNRD